MCFISDEPHRENIAQRRDDQMRILADKQFEAGSEILIGVFWNYFKRHGIFLMISNACSKHNKIRDSPWSIKSACILSFMKRDNL
jgi:hypothetical protein